ncbi:MAG: hypothetical protein ACTSVB_02005 [Candidatus Heimdallarchaeaceae archaeon]
MKKGQSAMEYLMTYGWAILIVIVVVAALYGMGVFSLKSGVTCSPCFSYFAFVDYADGTIMIRNGAQAIDTISVNTGSITPTTADPGDDLTITGISTTGDVDITITYNVTDSGLQHTDTATIHN